jgi:hypothetical protein
MRLIRPMRDSDRLHLRPHIGQRGVLAHTLRTVDQYRAVTHIQRYARYEDLRLGDLDESEFRVASADGGSRVEYNESCGVDLDLYASSSVSALHRLEKIEGLCGNTINAEHKNQEVVLIS